MRRTPIHKMPIWVEFAVLTLAVTTVSLVLGLLIRGFTLDGAGLSSQAIELMQVESVAVEADEASFSIAVVPHVILPPPETPESPEAPEVTPEIIPKVQETPAPPAIASGGMFDGRPIRVARTVSMRVTAYSPDSRSCGKWADGITASGYSVWTNGMKLVAADTRLLPFGTILTVPGYNDEQPVQVLDRGGKIKGQRLDVLYPTHEIARQWGSQPLTVTVWEYAD